MLVKNNLENSIDFLLDNFSKNNIHWNKKIARLVYSIREDRYPMDKNFINELSKQAIFLGGIEKEDNKFNIIPKQLIITIIIIKLTILYSLQLYFS